MPGQRNYFPLHGAQFPGAQLLMGSFIPNGAGDPAAVAPNKNGKFTVSAPTAGVHTVTLTDGPISGAAIGFGAFIVDTAVNSTKRAIISDVSTLTEDGKFKVTTQSAAGTDANLSAVVVTFFIIFSSSSTVL